MRAIIWKFMPYIAGLHQINFVLRVINSNKNGLDTADLR